MYCNKCGKQIESGIVCPECAIAEYEETHFGKKSTEELNPTYDASTAYYVEPHNRMYGFKLALAGQILAVVGIFVSYFAIIANLISSGTGFVFALVSVVFVVLPMIMGIYSIQTFKERKHLRKKPIATLVLGISTLTTLPISAIYTLIAFVLVGAL